MRTWRVLVTAAAIAAGVVVAPSAASAVTYAFTGHVEAAQRATGGHWGAHEFPVTEPSRVEVTLDWSTASADLNLFLRDPARRTVAMANSTTAHPEVIVHNADTSGTWSVGVKAQAGASDYTVTVVVTPDSALPSIGDRVWVDANGDGEQDAGESGLGGVDVTLLDDSEQVLRSTTTASDGSYSFAGIATGTYELAFVLPPDYRFAARDATDDGHDSDPDPTTGRTGTFTVASADTTRDAGAVLATSLHTTLNDAVAVDADAYRPHDVLVTRTGTIEATLDWMESGADLSLFLKDPSGAMVATSASNARPERIRFHAQVTGTYKVAAKAVSGGSSYTLSVAHSPGGTPPRSEIATYSAVFGFRGHAGLYAYGMDWDATDDTILVGDIWNYRVLRFTKDGNLVGVVSKHAGQGELGGIQDPFDIEADPEGHVWVANQAQSRIVEFDHDGNWIKTIGLGGGPESYQSYARGCGGGGQMYWPTHIVVHPTTRDVYVTDPYCRDVVVFDHDGRFKFEFEMDLRDVGIYQPTPRGIDVDAAGDLYVVEHNSRRIVKYDSGGRRLAISPRFDAMRDPRGMAIDQGRGLIYLVAAFDNEVFQFRTDLSLVARWDNAGGTPFDSIRFPAVDGDGNVYVGDTWAYRVWRLTSSGSVLPWATPPRPPPNGGYNQVNGIGVDHATGDLYAVDTFEQRAQRFGTRRNDGTTSWCRSRTDCPAYEMQWGSRESPRPNKPIFNYPRALAVGGGSVWIESSKAVARYDLDGNFIARWGEAGDAPGQFRSGPRGLAILEGSTPGTGRVFTTDQGNCRLQIFDFSGTLLDYMGSCGTGTDQMEGPWDVWADADLAYVADSGRNRIAVWDTATDSIVRTFSGPFDGIALKRPRGVAVDPTGSWVYISDTGNRRVVRIRPDGREPQVVTVGRDTPEGRFGGPENLAFGPDGRLYISDNNQRVYAFTIGS